MNKTVQELNMEIDSIKNIQTAEILVVKQLGIQTGTREGNFTNKIWEMEERISSSENMIGKNEYMGQRNS